MTILSKSEFADAMGWSRPYVSKLARNGRLVLTAEGKVDFEATKALLADTADPSKAAVAARHAAGRVERDVHGLLDPRAPVSDADRSASAGYQTARTRRESALAELAEIELDKAHGNLVDRKPVEDAAFETARATRDLVLGVPRQVAAELAALTDEWEIERRLVAALRRALEDAARVAALPAEAAPTIN